jgi:hypothetical protein
MCWGSGGVFITLSNGYSHCDSLPSSLTSTKVTVTDRCGQCRAGRMRSRCLSDKNKLSSLYHDSVVVHYGFVTCPHVSRVSSVSIVSGYGLDDRAIEVRSPAEDKLFFLYPLCPDRLWGPPSLLSNVYLGVLFPGAKRVPGVTLTTHPILCRGRE